jgi:hypothetical protein
MEDTNFSTSIKGIVSGAYTTNPLKSLTYIGEKRAKGKMK